MTETPAEGARATGPLGVTFLTSRLRGTVDGVVVLDSEQSAFVTEPAEPRGFSAVPRGDLAAGVLVVTERPAGGEHAGADRYADVVVGRDRRTDAAWTYAVEELREHVGLRWDAVDRWREEDADVVEHPRNPYHRVDAVRSGRHVVVRVGERVLAETTRPTAVFETGLPTQWYIPEQDAVFDDLVDVDVHTGCPFKGVASYRALAAEPARPVQWHYPQPLDGAAGIAGHVAFYADRVDVVVDGVRQDATSPRTADRPTDVPEEEPVTVQDAERSVSVSRRHPVPEGDLTYEPSGRWVRGTVGDTTVVDAKHPVLVWEPGAAVPLYTFPRSEVRADLLSPATEPPAHDRPGAVEWYDLTVDGAVLPAVAWTYAVPELADHVAFEWFRRVGRGVEHWYEEDEEIHVHPRDPYKRVDPLPSSRHVRVEIDGHVVADTHNPVLLYETRLPTRYYVPADDVDFTYLVPSDLTTGCPYKGTASYWSFAADGETLPDIAWTYPEPIRAAEPIRDLVAFYNELVDITVDDVRVERPHTVFSRGSS